MKVMVSINCLGFISREVVECEAIFQVEGISLMLHRPIKWDRDAHTVWHISDMESGLLICKGLSEQYVTLKAKKLVSKHKDKMLKKKDEFLKTAVFI